MDIEKVILASLSSDTIPHSFPFVTKTQLSKLCAPLAKEHSRLQRIRAFDSTQLSQEELTKLSDLEKITAIWPHIIEEASDDMPQNIHILHSLCETISLNERIDAWVDHLLEAMQEETYPLSLAYWILDDMITTPLQFAGVVLCLLSKNVSVEAILHSGLLHRFFESEDPEHTKEMFAILKSVADRGTTANDTFNQTLNALLDTSAKTSCIPENLYGSDIYPNHALDGHFITANAPVLTRVRVNKPETVFTQTLDNFSKLHALFGHQFLIQVLNLIVFKEDEEEEEEDIQYNFLKDSLKKMTGSDIGRLYWFINTKQAKVLRKHFFTILGKLLSAEQAQLLFTTTDMGWITLDTIPILIDNLSDLQLQTLAEQPLTAGNFEYAASISQHERFIPYLDPIYIQLVDHITSTPQLINAEEVEEDSRFTLITTLRAYPKTASWCQGKAQILREALLQSLELNTPFTLEKYQAVSDVFSDQKSTSKILRDLSREKLDYPSPGIYGLQAFIMRELFEKNPSFNVLTCLEEMHNSPSIASYTDEERLTGKCRTLYECLILQDNHDFQQRVIDALVSLGQENWIDAAPRGLPLLVEAIINGNNSLLKRYPLPTMADEERWGELQAINNMLLEKKGHSLLTQVVIDNPLALPTALALYPQNRLIEAINEKDRYSRHGITLLHYSAIFNPDALQVILDALSESDRLKAVKEQDNEGRPVLHYASQSHQALRLILSIFPKTALLEAIKEKDDDGVSVLDLAAENHQTLQIILDALPDDAKLEMIREEDDYDRTLLHKAVKNYKVLQIILNTLPENDRLKAVNAQDVSGRNILHLITLNFCEESPEALQLILNLYPIEARLEAFNIKDSRGKTPLDYIIENHQALNTILNALPEDARLVIARKKDSDGKTILHHALSNLDNLRLILTALQHKPEAISVIEPHSNEQALEHFDNVFENMKLKAEEIKNKHNPLYHEADAEAQRLIGIITTAKDLLMTSGSSHDLKIFKEVCLIAIEEARPVLEIHRGWGKILTELTSAVVSILTLGVFNCLTGRSLFGLFIPPQTDSAKKLNKLEHASVQLSH